MEPLGSDTAKQTMSSSVASKSVHAGKSYEVKTYSHEETLHQMSALCTEIKQLNGLLEAKKGVLQKGLQLVKNIAKSPVASTTQVTDAVFDKEVLGLDKKELKKLIKTKEAALESLNEKAALFGKVLDMFNKGEATTLLPAVREVFEENSQADPKKPNVEVAGISLSHQTHRDLILGACQLEINGKLFTKQEAVNELLKHVSADTAKNIFALTNQQLAITLSPFQTANRHPEIYQKLKAAGFQANLANEALLFKIDVRENGRVTLSLEAKIRVQERESGDIVAVVNARVSIENVQTFPVRASAELRYTLH